jgi:hypothetical protein
VSSAKGMPFHFNTRVIWKVTSGELLTKQAMRKNVVIYIKYIHKLLLNIVTDGTEALVISENTFL